MVSKAPIYASEGERLVWGRTPGAKALAHHFLAMWHDHATYCMGLSFQIFEMMRKVCLAGLFWNKVLAAAVMSTLQALGTVRKASGWMMLMDFWA